MQGNVDAGGKFAYVSSIVPPARRTADEARTQNNVKDAIIYFICPPNVSMYRNKGVEGALFVKRNVEECSDNGERVLTAV